MKSKSITVHEAANMLNESGRCLADFLQCHHIDYLDEVRKRDVKEFIANTEPCGPITD